MTSKQYILEYAEQNIMFAPDELWSWIKEITNLSKNSMVCMLSRMTANGELLRTGKGIYSKPEGKTVFKPQAGENEKRVFNIIKGKLPYAPLCIYNGSILAPLQHHLSENTMTYVETDKMAMEAVFEILKKVGEKVWLQPNDDMIYRYINLKEGGVIVKPLVTEAPITIYEDIPQPTLEKLLVDIRKDPDFSYMQGTEWKRMWENANTMYNINKSRLGRYARRRGLKNIDEL